MKKDEEHDEMRAEYDLRGGVRGKYYQRYREGTNTHPPVIALFPPVAGFQARMWLVADDRFRAAAPATHPEVGEI
jgi:hypothetical protein